jgi:hypothetical protein
VLKKVIEAKPKSYCQIIQSQASLLVNGVGILNTTPGEIAWHHGKEPSFLERFTLGCMAYMTILGAFLFLVARYLMTMAEMPRLETTSIVGLDAISDARFSTSKFLPLHMLITVDYAQMHETALKLRPNALPPLLLSDNAFSEEDQLWLDTVYCGGMQGSFMAGDSLTALDCELFYFSNENTVIVH